MNEESNGSSSGGGPSLLIASNRLPLQLRRDREGRWSRTASSGGLVTALEPVLKQGGGTWVGWPGVLEEDASLDELREALGPRDDRGYDVEPVPLTGRERRQFYLGFSNEILWPLCHGLPGRCNFEPRYWEVYRRVNRKFARAIAGVADENTFLWIHDYHLMAVAEELRALGVENRAGFFLHIPFPAPDIFEQLPWAEEVLESLLHFELVGFQTERDVQNFLDCVESTPELDVLVRGDRVRVGEHWTRVGAFPISIDVEHFRDGARTEEVAGRTARLRQEIGTEHIILGVDRLDYTKGIPQKLEGLERALERHPDLRGKVTLVQLVVPSREKIPEYDRMRKRIEGMVGRINGQFTSRGWAPVLYQFGRWEDPELLAFYRAADVALVTPLRDGMNLVSKEFCAASVEDRGVLVLSSFAGSADELEEGALLVNPNDVDAVADAIHRACVMEDEERRSRMEWLQRQVRGWDVHRWVDAFLSVARREQALDAGDAGDAEPIRGSGRRLPEGTEEGFASDAASGGGAAEGRRSGLNGRFRERRKGERRGADAADVDRGTGEASDDTRSPNAAHRTPAAETAAASAGERQETSGRRRWPERWRRRIRYARLRSGST